MTPEETAIATAGAVSGLSSHFMLDGATYERGGELGFDGMAFYVAGRGGALGDVHASVVAAAFVFFEPGAIASRWESSRPVMSRLDAAAAFARCGHEWARTQLSDEVDWARLAELAGIVAHAASPAGAPVMAAWRCLAEPDDDDAKALALHRMNLLRELRMAMHGAAILAAGITPLEALMVRTPYMAGLFGWDEPHPDAEPARAAWKQAEAATDRMMSTHLAVLDEAQRKELVQLAGDAHDATG